MKLLIILFSWTGCLLPYLASYRQQLLLKRFPKLLAWAGFILFQGLAIYGLSGFYDLITASLIWLMILMCMWVTLILISSHLSKRILLVSMFGAVFFSLIILSGGSHVA